MDEMDDRMNQIKTFYPFITILKSYENQKEDEAFDIPSLCLALLSFLIYEGRLKYKGLTLAEIIEFMTGFIKEAYGEYKDKATAKEYVKIALDMLQNEGRNYLFTHYSIRDRQKKQKLMKLIEMKLDETGNTVLYHVTKEGLDFFLKTKEFPEETQITVNLLLFRKQIEKGSFDYALETVKRLNLEVQRKIEKKNWILELLMYGGKEGTAAYREYHENALLQFKEENQLFIDVNRLLNNVSGEYIDKLNRNLITEKEMNAITVLKRIEDGIHNAMEKHTKLLQEAARLTKEYDQILKLRTKAAFSERFNFEGEFEKIAAQTDNPRNLKFIIDPLLMPNRKKTFHVLKAMSPQRLLTDQKKDGDHEREELEKIYLPSLDELTRERVQKNFVIYAEHLLQLLSKVSEFDLKEWSESLKKTYSEMAVTNGDFISFIIEINRGKPAGSWVKEYDLDKSVSLSDEESNDDMEFLLIDVKRRLKERIPYTRLIVESNPDHDVDMGSGLKITEIIFKRNQ